MSNSTSTPAVQVVLVKGRYHRDSCKRVQAEQMSPYDITPSVVSSDRPAATCCKPNNSAEWKAVAAQIATGDQVAAEAEATADKVAEETTAEKTKRAKAAHPAKGKKAAPAKAEKAAPAKAEAPAGPKRRVGSKDAEGHDVAYRGVGWVRFWPTVGNIAGQRLVDVLEGVETTWVDNVALGMRINGKTRAVKKAEGLLSTLWAGARPALKEYFSVHPEVVAGLSGKEQFIVEKDFLSAYGEGFVDEVAGRKAAKVNRSSHGKAGYSAGRNAAGMDIL